MNKNESYSRINAGSKIDERHDISSPKGEGRVPPPRPPGLNGANVSSHMHEGDRGGDEGMHERTRVCRA